MRADPVTGGFLDHYKQNTQFSITKITANEKRPVTTSLTGRYQVIAEYKDDSTSDMIRQLRATIKCLMSRSDCT